MPTGSAREERPERDLDVVIFGATGFVGRLVAQRLAAADLDGLRIGLAGRSHERLTTVQRTLGVSWPLLVADSLDDAAMARLAGSARVVISSMW